MNNIEKLENYFLELYSKYKKYSFEFFLEKIFHYNIKMCNYNKPIFFDLKKVLSDSLNEKISSEIKYWDSVGWKNVFIKFNKKYNKNNKIVLDFPIFESDLNKICPTIIKYIIYSGINSKISIHDKNKNPLFKIEIYSINDANKIIDFFDINHKISLTSKSRVLPFLIQRNYIGIYKEYDNLDFKNVYLKYLYEFLNSCKKTNDVKIESFILFLNNKLDNENIINNKRMISFIISYINNYSNDNYDKLFS